MDDDESWHHVDDMENCFVRLRELEKMVAEQAKKIQEVERKLMHFEALDARCKNIMLRTHHPFAFRPEPVFTPMTSQELLEARLKNNNLPFQ